MLSHCDNNIAAIQMAQEFTSLILCVQHFCGQDIETMTNCFSARMPSLTCMEMAQLEPTELESTPEPTPPQQDFVSSTSSSILLVLHPLPTQKTGTCSSKS